MTELSTSIEALHAEHEDSVSKLRKTGIVLLYISIIPITAIYMTIRLISAIQTFVLFDIARMTMLIVFSHIIAAEDLLYKRVPNKTVIAMIAAWMAVTLPSMIFSFDAALQYIMKGALGAAVSGILFLAVYLLSRHGLGGGDVKFMTAAGLLITFDSALTVMISGTLLAGITSVILLIAHRVTRKTAIPLVPFLYIGILTALYTRL